MPVDLTSYKMIYNEIVYHPISILNAIHGDRHLNENGFYTPKQLEVMVVDMDGEIRIICDETFMFKFVRR